MTQTVKWPADARVTPDSTTTVPTPLKMLPTSSDIQLEANGDTINQICKDEDDSCHTSTMPSGWIREVRMRKKGKTAGKLDVYVIR